MNDMNMNDLNDSAATTDTTHATDATEAPKRKRNYAWRCANVPGYHERYLADQRAYYRRAKDANPAEYNAKRAADWKRRYQEDEGFKAKVVESSLRYRAKQKLLREGNDD